MENQIRKASISRWRPFLILGKDSSGERKGRRNELGKITEMPGMRPGIRKNRQICLRVLFWPPGSGVRLRKNQERYFPGKNRLPSPEYLALPGTSSGRGNHLQHP